MKKELHFSMKEISNKKHFILNVLTNYGSTIIQTIMGFITVPIALAYWDNELYGVWLIITSFSVYITTSGLGIDTATGILMTKNPDNVVKIQIFKKGLLLISISITLVTLLFLLIINFFPNWIKVLGKMSDSTLEIARVVSIIFFFSILVNLFFNVISCSFAAFQKTYINNLISFVSIILNFVNLIITVICKFSFITYIVFNGLIIVLLGLVKIVIFCKIVSQQNIPNSKILVTAEDNNYKNILKTGLRFSFYGIAIVMVSNVSNLIISNFIDIKSVVPYSMIYKLYSMAFLLLASLNVSLSPILGKKFGEKDWTWITDKYKTFFKITVAFSSLIYIGIIFLGKEFIILWVGEDRYPGLQISLILGFYFFLFGLTNLNLVLINAFNFTKLIALITWLDVLVFFCFSIPAFKFIGISSIPLGLSMGSLLVSSWALPFILYKRSNKHITYDFKFLLLIIVILTVCFIIGLSIKKTITSFNGHVIFGVCICLIYVFFLTFILKNDILKIIKLRSRK